LGTSRKFSRLAHGGTLRSQNDASGDSQMMRRVKKAWPGTGVRSIYRAEKFLALKARYELLVQSQGLPAAPVIASIFARVAPTANGADGEAYLELVKEAITWPDVDVLEEAIIGVLPAAELPAQLTLQRLIYSQTVTSTEFAQYQRTMVDLTKVGLPPAPPFSDQIRSECLAVTQRIKYMLQYGPAKERARAALTNSVIATMVLGIGIIAGLYIASEVFAQKYGGTFIPTEAVFVVLCAGLVGGFISVQQRLQEVTEVDPLYKWLELDASGKSLLVSPLIGMVFAVVLFVILVGGFVTGDLFPTFVGCKGQILAAAVIHCKDSDFASLALAATPDSPASWAKLGIWAFAAGFLERLVPDILTRIAAVADKSLS
jgi:hypothetical protein